MELASATELPFISDAITSGYGWRPIVGYEGTYEVSWCGCVRRIAGGSGVTLNSKGWACRMSRPGGGKSRLYRRVNLCQDGKRRTIALHIVVALAWLGSQPEDELGKFEVHHKDNNITNNCAENLSWMSKEANMKEARHRYVTKGQAF